MCDVAVTQGDLGSGIGSVLWARNVQVRSQWSGLRATQHHTRVTMSANRSEQSSKMPAELDRCRREEEKAKANGSVRAETDEGFTSHIQLVSDELP